MCSEVPAVTQREPMELSDFESFHYLYRSLWNEEDSERYKINMMDTIIFQHGVPFRWLFTSEQTGEVLRKKNCKVTPSEIVASLKKRAGKLRGKKISHRDITKFASVWYRETTGKLVLRLIDEAELYFLLGDRTYTQLVSAIQVFFNGLPFKGSGIFEHNYLNVSSSPPTANNYKTFELLSPPPPIDMIEFGNQTAAFDYHGQNNPLHHRASSIDWKGNINEPNHGNSYPFTNEKILVTGAHEEILRLKTNQIIRLIENVVQSKVLKISLLYYFNTSLVPFIVSCERVVVEPKGHLANPLDDVLPSPPKVEDIEMLKKIEHDERNAMLRKLQMDVTTGHKTKYNRMESDIEVVGVKSSSDKFSKSSPLKKQLQRTASDIYGTTHDFEIRKEISKEVRQNSQPTILQPPPQINPNDHTPEEDLENIYRQRIPNTTELRSKFSGTRRTMLGNFISLGPKGSPLKEQLKSPTNDSPNNNNNNLTSTILSHYKIGIGADKAPKDSIKSKHYTQITDSYSYRIKSYSDRIRGQPESTSKKSLSSNLGASKSQAVLSQDIMEDYQGVHGVDVGGIRSSGLVKKLALQGHTCWGDYCNLLSSLHASPDDTKEYLHSIGMVKVTMVDGTIRIKSTRTELNQITCKSILLARTESKYIGGELSVMENIESYEYLEGDVLNACAHQHVQKVAEKCRKEAFTSLVHSGLKSIPSMSDLQAVAYTYRNMIYNDALSQVHPARFYLTVPACRICSQLYTALDRCRDEYIYRPNSHDPVIRTIGKVDDGNLSADIVHKARKVLKAKANHYRSLENNEEADLEVPESRQESDGLDYSMSKLSPHEECDNDDQEDEEGEEEENEQQFSSNIIPPSQMVRGVSSEQSNLQRRRSELLQGHQLGGLGAVTQKIEDRTSPTKLIKQIAGTRSSGSFPVWVDLMVAAQGPDVTQLKKVETKKERVVSPETLERRKSMQLFRKVEKMDWRTMLRDESATKLLRPKSASAINTQRPNSASRSRRTNQAPERAYSPVEHDPPQYGWDNNYRYGETIPFTQAPYLPYRPRMEDNEKDLIRTGTHDDDDELAFLHDSPSVKQKQQKVPKVFPIAGAVADSKYK